jgi:lipopolysaccharide transport system ATP-binding protein
VSTVIKVESLSKKYIIGHSQKEHNLTLRDTMAQIFKNFGKRLLHPLISSSGQSLIGLDTTEDLWALRDVSFEVQKGERVGIIGRNGAGKSTLLKILSRITEPTTGRVRIKGRVASLLEVGTGFHPELTGRENIFLNGAVLGMAKAEIKKKFHEIVAFAEIEKFLDTPVKRYSSGMYVRLAFAVAAHLEPEILVVDEVLAVGDAQFQKKCLGKMQEVGKEGRTVLFVSHNMQAIQTLCNRAVWINSGSVEQDGAVFSVVSTYLNKGFANIVEQHWPDEEAPGNENIRLKSVRLISGNGGLAPITVKTPFKIEFVFELLLSKAFFFLGIHLLTSMGERAFVTVSQPKEIRQGVYKYTCNIPGDLLNNGAYTIETYFAKDSNVVLYRGDNLLMFEVIEAEREEGSFLGELPGAVRPKLKWDAEQI